MRGRRLTCLVRLTGRVLIQRLRARPVGIATHEANQRLLSGPGGHRSVHQAEPNARNSEGLVRDWDCLEDYTRPIEVTRVEEPIHLPDMAHMAGVRTASAHLG